MFRRDCCDRAHCEWNTADRKTPICRCSRGKYPSTRRCQNRRKHTLLHWSREDAYSEISLPCESSGCHWSPQALLQTRKEVGTRTSQVGRRTERAKQPPPRPSSEV